MSKSISPKFVNILELFKKKAKGSRIKTFVLLFGFISMILPQLAYGWSINSFESDIKIRPDATIQVTETIVADFTRDPHRGIYRIVPTDYQDASGKNLSLNFKLSSVTDEKDQPWHYEETTEEGNTKIKIGDAKIMLRGPSTFKIQYQIENAINHFNDHDELYWNVTGNDWGVPIKQAGAQITLPPAIAPRNIIVKCYTGVKNAKQTNCTASTKESYAEFQTKSLTNKQSTGLGPDEGLTIVVGFPKNLISPSATTASSTLESQETTASLSKDTQVKNEKTPAVTHKMPEDLDPTYINTITAYLYQHWFYGLMLVSGLILAIIIHKIKD